MDFTGLCCGMSAFSWMYFDSLSQKEDAAEKKKQGKKRNNLLLDRCTMLGDAKSQRNTGKEPQIKSRPQICGNSSHSSQIEMEKRKQH